VQILVVVAIIQVRTLKTEVEKGFIRTAIDYELVDPKSQVNPIKMYYNIGFFFNLILYYI